MNNQSSSTWLDFDPFARNSISSRDPRTENERFSASANTTTSATIPTIPSIMLFLYNLIIQFIATTIICCYSYLTVLRSTVNSLL